MRRVGPGVRDVVPVWELPGDTRGSVVGLEPDGLEVAGFILWTRGTVVQSNAFP